jgi:hypothetical protein
MTTTMAIKYRGEVGSFPTALLPLPTSTSRSRTSSSDLTESQDAMAESDSVLVMHEFERIRGSGAPNPSPFCVKLETFLRLAQIKHTVVYGSQFGPKGKVSVAPRTCMPPHGRHHTHTSERKSGHVAGAVGGI